MSCSAQKNWQASCQPASPLRRSYLLIIVIRTALQSRAAIVGGLVIRTILIG